MVDSAAPLQKTQLKPRLLLKHLSIDPRAQGNNTALKLTLSSLINSNFTQINIAPPLRVSFQGEILSERYNNLTTTTQARSFETENDKNEQKGHLYYTDIAAFLKDIKIWISNYDLEGKYDGILEKHDYSLIDWVNVDSDSDYADDYYLAEKHEKLLEVAHHLLDIFDELAKETTQTTGGYDSLTLLIDQLKNNPRLTTSSEVWTPVLSHITEGFAKSKTQDDGVVVQTENNSYVTSAANKIRVSETRQLYHYFITGLRLVVEDPSLLSGKQRNKPIATILTTDEVTQIKTDSDLYFPEKVGTGTEFTSAEELITLDDVRHAQALKKFLLDQGVMARILGEKALPPGAGGGEAAAKAEPDGEGGGVGEAETPLTPDQLTELILDEATKRVTDRLRIKALVVNDIYKENLISAVTEAIHLELSSFRTITLDPTTVSVSVTTDGQTETISLFDSETGLILRNEYFKQWFESYVENFTQSFIQSHPDEATYVDKLLGDAEALLGIGTEPETDPDLVNQTPEQTDELFQSDQAGVPTEKIREMVRQMRLRELDASGEISKEWWDSLNDAERRAVATELLGGQGVVELLTQTLLKNDPLFASLDLTNLSPADRAALDAQLNTILTDFDNVLRIRQNPYAARFWLFNQLKTSAAAITLSGRLTQEQTPVVVRDRTVLEAEEKQSMAELQAELKLNTAELMNVENGLDTLILLSRDPAFFIDSLDRAKVLRYFNLTLSSDPAEATRQLQSIKLYLLRYISARQEEFALETQVQGFAENEEDLNGYFEGTKAFVRNYGGLNTAAGFNDEYDDGATLEELRTENEEDKVRRIIKQSMMEALWAEIALEQQQALHYEANPGATSINSAYAPGNSTVSGLMNVVNQAQQNQAPPSRLDSLRARFAGKSPVKNLKDQAMQKGLEKALALAPGIGQAAGVVLAAKNALGLSWKDIALIGGAAIGAAAAALYALYKFVLSQPLVVISGLLTGGLTILSGGSLGAVALATASGGVGGYFAKEMGTRALTSAGSAGKAISSGAVVTNGQVAAAVGGGAFCAITAYAAQQMAFLDPLPTYDSTGNYSKYVDIVKRSSVPNILPNDQVPTTVTYTITITPKDDYEIKITDASDLMTFEYKDESKTKDAITRALSQFPELQNGSLVLKPGEKVELSYTQPLEATDIDARIENDFKIDFSYVNTTDNTEVGEEKASTNESICVGDCPKPAAGCWPVDGKITQGPLSQPRLFGATHDSVQAIDFHRPDNMTPANFEDSPVYTPYAGRACAFPVGQSRAWTCKAEPFGPQCYGNIVVVSMDGGGELGFAHMSSINDDLLSAPGRCKDVEAGYQVGGVGNTGLGYGNGEGVHLHYEVRGGLRMVEVIPKDEKIEIKDVKTCYKPGAKNERGAENER